MDKIVLTAQDLLEDSIELGIKVLESGFEPTMIIAIWRGGTPVGMAVQEVFAYCGIESDHIAIRTSSYIGVDERGRVAVHGLNYIIKKICHDDRVLIVDDVFDETSTRQYSRRHSGGGTVVQTHAQRNRHYAGLLFARNSRVAGFPPRA